MNTAIPMHGRTAFRVLLYFLFLQTISPLAAQPNLDTDSLRKLMYADAAPHTRLDAARMYIRELYNFQQYDSVKAYIAEWMPLAEAHGHKQFISCVHLYRGGFHSKAGRVDSALYELEQCSKVAMNANDTIMITRAMKMLAHIYYSQRDSARLSQLCQRALAFSAHPEGLPLIEQMSMYYGLFLSHVNAYDSSEYYLHKAMQLAKGFSNKGYYYQASYSMANLYKRTGRYDDALRLLEEAKPYYIANKMDNAIAASKATLGFILNQKKQFRKAITLFREALDYAEPRQDNEIMGDVYPNLSTSYAALGQWEQAYNYMVLYAARQDSLHSLQNKTALADLKTRFDNELKARENTLLSLQLEARKQVISRQRWMIGAAAVMLLLLLLGYWLYLRYRRRQWQQQIALMQMDSELKSLKSQLDPHFIHNFFSFLARHIHRQHSTATVHLLDECSLYFRQILTRNREHIISLENEIEGLNRYLNIQQKIHGEIFDYTIHADENVDTFGIELPAFLFQPFVENSLKHGFGQPAQKGKLTIHFSSDGSYLEGTITDNGNGMTMEEDAAGNNNKSVPVGMSLTVERLNLFTRLRKRKPGSIESGKMPGNEGYYVRVRIPLA